MAAFIVTTPDGKFRVNGPDNMTEQEAYSHAVSQQPPSPGLLKSAASGLIQGAGAPGDFSSNALSNAPPQQPVDRDTYYGKLVDALNAARKHLELPTTPQVGNAVGMQPTQPQTMAEKAVQGGASMIPGALMGGSPTGKAVMGAAPAASAVRGMGMTPQGPASAIPQASDALQAQLLNAAKQHGGEVAGHVLGGPLGGMAAKFAPHVLRLMKQ